MSNLTLTSDANTDPRWKALYIIGGVAALLIVVLWSIEIVGVVTMGQPPDTTIRWFMLYDQFGLLGLFDSFLLDIAVAALMIPVFLALYMVLKRSSELLVAIAVTLMFVGVTLYLAMNPTLPMFHLHTQYAAATTDAQRSQLIATGQAILEFGQFGTGGAVAFVLQSLAGLIISIVMLRGNTFSKVTAYAGVLANVLQLAEPPAAFVPASIYENMGIGFLLMMISFVFFVIWYILVARKLFQLGRLESKPLPRQSQVDNPLKGAAHVSQ